MTIWILGTGFAMAMAAFAVRLAGAGVTDGALPAMAASDVEAELDANRAADPMSTIDVPGSVPPTETDPSTAAAGDGASPTVTPDGGAPAPTTTQAPSAGHQSGSPAGSSGSGSSGSDSSSGSSGSGNSSGSSGSGSSGPGGAPTTAAPTTTQPPSSTHTIAAVGGSVTVRCVGSTVAILAASPTGGFAVDVRTSGPDEIEVRFESKDHTSTVKSTCAAGVAQPRVQESGRG